MPKNLTLGLFLKLSVGKRVVVELKDETAIEGTIEIVHPKTLNTSLVDTILYRRRFKNLQPEKLTYFFIKGKVGTSPLYRKLT